MAKTRSAPSAKAEVSLSDIPQMPWEKAGTSEGADESSLLAIAGSLLGDEDPVTDEPVADEAETVEDETDEEIVAETETESDEADEPEAEPEQPEEPVFEIDGEKVTLSELRKDRLRQADYTRKTQELAKQRESVESEVTAYREKRDAYASLLSQVEAALKEPEPDWQKIREEDPDSYAQTFADFQLRKQQREAVAQERERIAAEQATERAEQIKSLRATEREKLIAAVPELQKKDEGERLVEYAAKTYGWTAKDLEDTLDHRLIVLLHKAMRFDALGAKGKETIAAVPATKVLKPGAKPVSHNSATAQKAKEQKALRAKALRTGREADELAYLASLLPDDF